MMRKSCTVCGRISDEARCPRHRRPRNACWSRNRDGAAHARFARAVKKRDGCCVHCGATENLQAHHKDGLTSYDPADGITLCSDCHRAVDPHAR